MIISRPPAPAPAPGPVASTPSPTDPGGLARRSELDADRDSRLDARDVTILAQRVQDASASGDDAAIDDATWRLNQARMLATLPGATGDTVRGAITVGSMPTSPNGSVAVADAVRAIGELDLTKLREAGVPLTAAFDYDDTLAEGDVFLPAMQALAEKGAFHADGDPALRAALAGAGVPKEVIDAGDVNARAALLTKLVVPTGAQVPIPGVTPVATSDAFYVFGDAMRGMDADVANRAMIEAFAHGVPSAGIEPLRTHLFDGPAPAGDSASDLVAGTRAAGLDPWIVTWGFDFIAKAAAPYVGIGADHVIGHGMHVRDGKFDGLVDASGRPKWEMLRDALRVPPIVSFGNSGSDLPMLDATAGPTFLVKPVSAAMRDALAQRTGRTFGLDYDAALAAPHAAAPAV